MKYVFYNTTTGKAIKIQTTEPTPEETTQYGSYTSFENYPERPTIEGQLSKLYINLETLEPYWVYENDPNYVAPPQTPKDVAETLNEISNMKTAIKSKITMLKQNIIEQQKEVIAKEYATNNAIAELQDEDLGVTNAELIQQWHSEGKMDNELWAAAIELGWITAEEKDAIINS